LLNAMPSGAASSVAVPEPPEMVADAVSVAGLMTEMLPARLLPIRPATRPG